MCAAPRSDPPPPPVALLDACVLAPLVTREALFAAARHGLFHARWSARIEAEWAHAAAKEARGLSPQMIAGDLALARAAFPDALVTEWEALEGPLSLPDWDDRHVLAAAVKANARLLITDNLRDFPSRALAAYGIRPVAADAFLSELYAERPTAMASALREMASAAPPEAMSSGLPALLKRARLPQLAKAVKRAAAP